MVNHSLHPETCFAPPPQPSPLPCTQRTHDLFPAPQKQSVLIFISQVSVHCADRGRLLMEIWMSQVRLGVAHSSKCGCAMGAACRNCGFMLGHAGWRHADVGVRAPPQALTEWVPIVFASAQAKLLEWWMGRQAHVQTKLKVATTEHQP